MKLAVIIPFYQRERGILARALRSVVAQVLPPDALVEIVVIDDESPASVHREVAAVQVTAPFSLRVISQANAGPGAARNAGLDYIARAGNFDFIAFLDSDDEWLPTHLNDAVEALERNYDFYFCDCARPGAFERYSAENRFTRNQGALLAERANTLRREPALRGFAAHALDREFLQHTLCHTSAVVVRTSTLRSLRFDPALRSAGEDWMCWIKILRNGFRPVISWASNVSCGRGVNIFFGAFDWNTPATLDRVGYHLLFAQKLRRIDPPVRGGEVLVDRLAGRYRRAYSFLFIRTLLRLRSPGLSLLRRLMRSDPILPLRMPWLFLLVLCDRRPESRQW